MLTGFIRRYAIDKSLLAIPNNRSSHTMATPNGGGGSVVIVTLLMSVVFWLQNILDSTNFWMIFAPGSIIAIVGWLDDHSHVKARWRLLLHFVAVIMALVMQGGLDSVVIFGYTLELGYWGYVLAAICLVWLLNLFNFMDGINGIAGIEAITVCLGGTLLYLLFFPDTSNWVMPLILSFAVLGFLFWNFPTAKIFMGDVGSGFLGMTLGVFSLQAAWFAEELFWGWIILIGVFVVDATTTLIRRLIRKEKLHKAHRNHAYQYISRKYKSHTKVSLAVGAINLFWLFPLAYLVASKRIDGMLGVIIAYLPLLIIAIKYKAGADEQQEL